MHILRFPIVYIVLKIKNALRKLKASFGLENKNLKPLKKNDVLIKKRVYLFILVIPFNPILSRTRNSITRLGASNSKKNLILINQ